VGAADLAHQYLSVYNKLILAKNEMHSDWRIPTSEKRELKELPMSRMLLKIKQSLAEGRTMLTILQNEDLANMPGAELEGTIEQFLAPVTRCLLDKRLGNVVKLAVQAKRLSQTPLITQMVRGLGLASRTIWAMAKRF
jgi:hypothetical protein